MEAESLTPYRYASDAVNDMSRRMRPFVQNAVCCVLTACWVELGRTRHVVSLDGASKDRDGLGNCLADRNMVLMCGM